VATTLQKGCRHFGSLFCRAANSCDSLALLASSTLAGLASSALGRAQRVLSALRLMMTLRLTTSSSPDLPSLTELTVTSSNAARTGPIHADFAQPALSRVELGGRSGGQNAGGKGRHRGSVAGVALKVDRADSECTTMNEL
jgi:hypothetical protein